MSTSITYAKDIGTKNSLLINKNTMIIWGLLILIVVLLLLIWYLLYKNIKITKVNTQLTNKIIEDQKRPIFLWTVNSFTQKDLARLQEIPEILEVLIKIFEYKIAKQNDFVRFSKWEEETNKNIGWLNALYDTHLFFYKLKQERDIVKNNKKV